LEAAVINYLFDPRVTISRNVKDAPFELLDLDIQVLIFLLDYVYLSLDFFNPVTGIFINMVFLQSGFQLLA
jgi:hypothetical protein